MNNLVNNFIWNGVHWTRMRGNQNGSLTVNGDIKITDRYGNIVIPPSGSITALLRSIASIVSVGISFTFIED